MGKRNNLFSKFALIVLGTVGIFLIFSSIVVYAYKFKQPKAPLQRFKDEYGNEITETDGIDTTDKHFMDAPDRTNFLVVGVDAITEGLTDVMLVGCFDTKTQMINLMSIPRDTKIDLDPKTTQRIKENGYGNYEYMKINSVNNFIGKKDGMEYVKLEVENLLNIKIDYYALINTKAFREIVDILGGVKMTLDRNYFYEDPLQDLYINLKAGEQILDGDAAEGLVRYRNDYIRGDEDRIEVQQRFMKELFSQALNKDNIIKNAPALLDQMLKYVRTDFNVLDAPPYLQYIDAIKGENFHFYTMPGAGETVVGDDGKDVSYFFYDRQKTNELVSNIFYGSTVKSTANNNINANSKNAEIVVLNGSGVKNAAGDKQIELIGEGFNVTGIGTYDGVQQKQTRIFVKSLTTGYDLLPYFNDAKVELDTINITSNSDIVIVLGTNE